MLDGGKYRIVAMIAEGGMGEVYQAEHTVMNKRVAIKRIRPGLSEKTRATERLLQEARAASRIHHPNVVDIYDVAREGDSVYLVMEFLEGEPLSALLGRGNLPMHRLIALLLPAMRGVLAAHRQGVVHRDIKPDNIFLTRVEDSQEPLPKVLDFGVSKLDPRGGEQLALTRSGGTVGTPLYMAYEQLRGSKTIDGRADVYAFGVILYEALTGRLPHAAESYPELIFRVTTCPLVPARQHNADIPGPLDRIVSWALAREAEERISLDALIRELEPFATETGFRADMETPEIPSTPAPARRPSDDDELAHDTTALASGLRGSEHISAVRAPLRTPRRRALALGALLVLLAALVVWRSRGAETLLPRLAVPDDAVASPAIIPSSLARGGTERFDAAPPTQPIAQSAEQSPPVAAGTSDLRSRAEEPRASTGLRSRAEEPRASTGALLPAPLTAEPEQPAAELPVATPAKRRRKRDQTGPVETRSAAADPAAPAADTAAPAAPTGLHLRLLELPKAKDFY